MNGLVIPARPVRRPLVGLGLAVLVLPGTVAAGVLVLSERLGNNVERIPAVLVSLNESTRPTMTDEQTFLLIGTDSRSAEPVPGTAAASVSGAQSADLLMIAQISADKRSVTIVSIPGDGWIDIPGRVSARSTAPTPPVRPGYSSRPSSSSRHGASTMSLSLTSPGPTRSSTPPCTASRWRWSTTSTARRRWSTSSSGTGCPGATPTVRTRQQDVLRVMLSKVITSGTLSSPVGSTVCWTRQVARSASMTR